MIRTTSLESKTSSKIKELNKGEKIKKSRAKEY